MSTAKESNGLTVVELKEKLKALGLNPTGNKSELIARLTKTDPSRTWMQADPEASKTDLASTAAASAVDYQREMEMCRREKELAERELTLTRAELQLLRGMRGLDVSDQEQRAEQDPVTVSSKLSITAIADLLGHFNGNTGDYENWEQQLTLLRRAYRLTEDYTKVLISMRLKGRALEWFHSDLTRRESSVDDLLSAA
jgi:hypothetical protein